MSDQLVEFLKLAPLGFVVGMYGTLIGAGGGFVLVPVLLFLLRDESPATITSMSLAVVFFNAYSGTISYARMRRIDYFAGAIFIAAGLPGAILGPILAHEIPRPGFEPLLGIVLLAGGLWLTFRPFGPLQPPPDRPSYEVSGRFNTLAGSIGSAYIGFVSNLLGIGGGVIQVPFFVRGLGFPPHIATATSQLVLAILTLTATVTHLALGAFSQGVDRTMYLAVGTLMGAPLGAIISSRIRGSMLVRLLALTLCIVGAKLVAGWVLQQPIAASLTAE